MADMHEELQRRIEEDRQQNPNCTYSTLRSSASSFNNGKVRAETLSRIIRNCQGKPPVEIYTHQETNDGGDSTSSMPRHPSSRGELAPFPPGAGGGAAGKDLFQGMFEDVMSGVFGGLFGALGVPPGAFPMHPPFEGGGGGGEGQQRRQHPHGRQPAPPHSFPRGGWQPRAGAGGGGSPPAYHGEGGRGDVTEI